MTLFSWSHLFCNPPSLFCREGLSIVLIVACAVLVSCTSTPSRSSTSIPVSTEPTPTPSPNQTSTPIASSLSGEPAENGAPMPGGFDFSRGVYLSSYSPGTINTLLEYNGAFPIQHVILDQASIRSVDDILFQEDARANVRRTARMAHSQRIAVFLWSREIHLEGKSFIFSKEAPLAVARQTAYRNALRSLPELSGIVVSFEDALRPPWQAESNVPPVSLSSSEKVRFIIQLLIETVIEEFGKQLVVSIPHQEPESTYVLDAVRAIDDRRLQLMTTSPRLAERSPLQGTMKIHLRVDLHEPKRSGSFYALPDAIRERFSIVDEDRHAGITVHVGESGHYIWNSVNGVNWMAFTAWSPGSTVHEVIWDQWIEQTLGASPVSDEGRLLRAMMDQGTFHAQPLLPRLYQMGITASRNDAARDSLDWDALTEYLKNNINRPSRQMLVDLAQDHFQIIEWTVGTIQEASRFLKPVMRQTVYEDLQNRLQSLYWNTMIRHFAVQCLLGKQLWKQTRDEQEALHLESHLQELERLAVSEQAAPYISPETQEWIPRFTDAIRDDFPRVLLGSKPREWNKISGIRVQQTHTNQAVLYWQTDVPARSRIFLSLEPPLFNRVIDGDDRDVIYHQAVLRDIDPDQNYAVRIQCVTPDGQVTNSGIFPLLLKSISL